MARSWNKGKPLVRIAAGLGGIWFLRRALADLVPAEAMAFTAFTVVLIGLLLVQRRSLSLERPRESIALLAAVSLTALLVMPQAARAHLRTGAVILLVAPVLLHLVWGGWQAVKAYEVRSRDPRKRLETALGELVPARLACLAAAEMMMISHVFKFGSPPDVPVGAEAFSYHRLVAPTMWAFLCIAVIEAGVTHLLVGLWNSKAAWMLLIMSDVGLVYLLSLTVSLRRLPITIDTDCVHIRTGFLYDFRIPLAEIANVRASFPASDVRLSGTLKTSLMTFPNLMLELNSPIPSPKPMGAGPPISRIAIALDDCQAFTEALRSAATRTPMVMNASSPAGR